MGRKSNYENGMFNQLQEIMNRLDSVEKELRTEKIEHREDVIRLNAKIDDLTQENILLRNDNARLRSIINNDSSNSSLPPSSDQKGGRPANTYNSRTETKRKAGGQKGHKGTTLTKADLEEKIKSGKCRHEVCTLGSWKSGKYVTKYVVGLKAETVITKVWIYDEKTLLNRMEKYSHNHLLFLHDFSVPFENNISERQRTGRKWQAVSERKVVTRCIARY